MQHLTITLSQRIDAILFLIWRRVQNDLILSYVLIDKQIHTVRVENNIN